MAGVAILVRHAEEAAVGIEQAEVAAPGVDADGHDVVAVFLHRAAQSFDDVAVKADDVPEGSAGEVGARIVKAVDLLELEGFQVGDAGDDAAAAGAEVDGEEDGHGLKS